MGKTRIGFGFFALAALFWGGAGFADGAETGRFAAGTALSYSQDMFDRQDNVTNKVAIALRARQTGLLPDAGLTFGGRFTGTIISEKTNTAGKFPILSRLPPTHTAGTSDTYSVLNDLSVNATLTMPNVTVFAQVEHTEVEYPGQDATQLRKYWVTLGDLNRSPYYLTFGRKTVNFGNFATYAPFTHSHSGHYFWAQTDDPHLEVGYLTDRTELAFSLIPAHRGLRVISTPENDGTFNNYAINLAHTLELGQDLSLRLGAGYLRGTIYDSTIAHHPPDVGVDRSWNGAWDVNATLSGHNFDLMAEYTETEDIWPATGHKVSALTVQGRYRDQLFSRPVTYSLSLSRGKQGPSGSEWERNDQAILGVEWQATDAIALGAEYMINEGFVPLIMPTVTGDRDVRSETVIVGLTMTF